jgi:hypothetical protein
MRSQGGNWAITSLMVLNVKVELLGFITVSLERIEYSMQEDINNPNNFGGL